MHVRIGRPRKDKQSYRHERAAADGYTSVNNHPSDRLPDRLTRRQSPFRHEFALLPRRHRVIPLKTRVVLAPERIGHDGKHHADKDAEKRAADLPQTKPIHAAEDRLERAEKEIQNPQQDRREDAQIQTHRLQRQQQHGPVDRLDDRLQDRLLRLLHRSDISLVSRFRAQFDRLALQEAGRCQHRKDNHTGKHLHRMVRFWHEHSDQN